ncbi:helix-turn-helix domain-containing protein [Saccharopolyspora griseoalba]|uniref:Helix-turn-helix domain-containing protein n=1 Tax=Saccharopolyspora griseoalba TaxID=1431848 RepID=A0ABW2LC82_9PSEU
MKWNLRLVAAQRGIWKATDLQRLLAEHGLVISAGKMSGLWSKTPASLKLEDLDVICEVLGCEVGELLLAETNRVPEQRHPQRDPGTPHPVDAPQSFAGGMP